jgi:Predicted N-acetylglucosaminyl transferase
MVLKKPKRNRRLPTDGYDPPSGALKDSDSMTPDEHEHTGPRRVLGRSGPAWLAYALVGLIVLALAGGLWVALAPESLARIHGQWLNRPLSIESLALIVDRQAVELPPNSTVEIHPGQRFAIAGLNTNRWHNYDLRLHCRDFNVAGITAGASATPRDLLAGETFERPRELRIEVLDKDQVVAAFTILTRFTVLDFLARGDAAPTPEAKIDSFQKALAIDPGSEAVRDKLIEALVEAGHTDRAADLLEEALARGGPEEGLLTRLLGFYQDLDTLPKQVETLGRLIELAESRGQPGAPFQIKLAELYKNHNLPAQAAEIYESLARGAAAPEAAAYLREMVSLYRAGRDSEKEIAALRRLTEITPPDQAAALWKEIVDLYTESGDEAGKLAAWRALAESLPEGTNKVNALKMIGLLLVQSEKDDEAREAYQTALKMAPEDPNILRNLANLGHRTGDRAAYRQYLGSLIEVKNGDLDLRRELAEALVQDKQNDQAKVQYQEILKQKPESRADRLALIELMEKTGDKKGLIAQYNRMSELYSKEKIVVYNLGALLFDNKEYAKAIDAFNKVIKLDPKDLEAREYLVAAYQRRPGKENKELMLAAALDLYKLAPSRTVYRTLLLNTYENDKDWKKFADVAREITKAEPKSAFGWESLARAQTALNEKTAAAESLWQAADRTAKDKKVEAWLKAAQAFYALKNNDKALEAYQKVKGLDPDNKTANRAITELETKKDQKNS